jgi:hypothetical protein
MSDFNNTMLDNWNSYIPATSSYKMKQIFLFTLLDAYLSLEVSNDEFLHGIKSILTEE